MNRLSRSILLASLAAVSGVAIAQDQDARVVEGDTLLIQRVQEKPDNLPTRGMSMAQVEAKYGAPGERLDPRGGQRHAWPTINRWVYANFTVYFEKSRVIDVVVNKAGDDEVGPKPATN